MGGGLGIDKHVPPVQSRYEDVPVSIVVNIVSRSQRKNIGIAASRQTKSRRTVVRLMTPSWNRIELAIAIDIQYSNARSMPLMQPTTFIHGSKVLSGKSRGVVPNGLGSHFDSGCPTRDSYVIENRLQVCFHPV